MSAQQAFVFAVLAATLVLFAWGRFRHDVVAAAALLAMVLAGIVPAESAFAGFGHPAVITVAAVLIISRALRNAGVVDAIAARIEPLTTSTPLHVAALTGACALCSGFMNNAGALALFLPVALATAARRQRPPAILLMPLAFGSILGGLVTMIGTPPNVIVALYRGNVAGEPFGLFDYAPVGAAVAIVGVIYVALIGWRLVPRHRRGADATSLFRMDEYITELRVADDSPLIGTTLGDAKPLAGEDLVVMSLHRGGRHIPNPSRWFALAAGDVLVIKADPANLEKVIADTGLLLPAADEEHDKTAEETRKPKNRDEDKQQTENDRPKGEDLQLVEAVVTPGSPLEGRNARFIPHYTANALSLLALGRRGSAIRRSPGSERLRAGDVLLLQGDTAGMTEALSDLGLLPLAERDLRLTRPSRRLLAIGIFAAALAATAGGLVPAAVAFIAAVGAYVVLDILPAREIYRDIDWPVIVLLAAMIPVGQALEQTGATALIANAIASTTSQAGPIVALTLLLIATMTLSDVVNNAATAVIMAPISVELADKLGVSSDPFLMAVAIGASCAFLTPIGHQSNTLVLGPGGYHFGDYWRVGLPLEVLIAAVAVPLIMVVWPL